jgi:hypothetical protein
MVLLAGITWGAFFSGREEVTLERGAWDVLVACRHARNEAMVSGWRHELCLGWEAEEPTFSLRAVPPWGDAQDAVPARPPHDRTIRFPEGTEAFVDLGTGGPEREEADEPVLAFYPDGSSDGGIIQMRGPRRSFEVSIKRLTGRATLTRKWTAALEAAESGGGEAGR